MLSREVDDRAKAPSKEGVFSCSCNLLRVSGPTLSVSREKYDFVVDIYILIVYDVLSGHLTVCFKFL